MTDAATRLQAARQAAALVTVTPVKLRDLTDRAAIATALRQQLIGVRFGPNNHVVFEGRRHVLTVQARAYGEKPKLRFGVTARHRGRSFACRRVRRSKSRRWRSDDVTGPRRIPARTVRASLAAFSGHPR